MELSHPAAIIQPLLGGQKSHYLIHPRAGWVPGSARCAQTAHALRARLIGELMAQASVTETCLHERLSAQLGGKERHDSTISESK